MVLSEEAETDPAALLREDDLVLPLYFFLACGEPLSDARAADEPALARLVADRLEELPPPPPQADGPSLSLEFPPLLSFLL